MMPPAMLPAMPSASTDCFLSRPSAADTPTVAAIAPSTLVGMESRLVDQLGRDQAQPAQGFHARRDSEQRGGAAALEALARGEHGGNDDRARVHRPALEGVVEILAVRGGAVDHRGVFRAEAAGVPDRGAGAAAVDARDQRAHVIGRAGGNAKSRDVDQQVFAARANGAGEAFGRERRNAVGQAFRDGLRGARISARF